MMKRGVENFVMVVHDGDSNHVMRGRGKKKVKEYRSNECAKRELEYMRKYGTLIKENPGNPYACNVASHATCRIGNSRKITFGGIEFDSMAAGGRHYGCGKGVFESWIKKGLTEPPEFRGNGNPVTWRGRRFPHTVAAAKWEGVTADCMRLWLRRGLTEPVPHATAIR